MFPIIVYKEKSRGIVSFGSLKPYMAVLIGNEQVRANGRTEEEAVEGLKRILMALIPPDAESIKLKDITLEELIIREVQEGLENKSAIQPV